MAAQVHTWAEIKLELGDVVRVDQEGEVHGDGAVYVVLVLRLNCPSQS